MARTKAVLGSGARLSDYLSASLLARVVPPEAVHAVLDAHSCNTERLRKFPAVAGVYYCMALSLYPEAAYEEVFSVVAQGLAWASGAAEPEVVGKASISRLRLRIGAAPLEELVRLCCVPMANEREHPEAFYAARRLVAIDGTCVELPDEPHNAKAFGYPGSRTSASGHAGYPQARCAVLVECDSHAVLGAAIGPYRSGEWDLGVQLLSHLGPGMLCLADRGFNGYEQWRQAADTGADLLWRCSDTRHLPVLKLLDDGSFLSRISPSGLGVEQAQQQSISVRVIEYRMPGDSQALPRYRLLTTLLDCKVAPALELAALYHRRWEIEAVFDELKTHLRQGRRLLRSKTPELVRQEFYGWVLAHYAVRWLLHRGAIHHRMRHAELSFKGHVELVRRTQPRSGAFPPSAAQAQTSMVQRTARRERSDQSNKDTAQALTANGQAPKHAVRTP